MPYDPNEIQSCAVLVYDSIYPQDGPFEAFVIEGARLSQREAAQIVLSEWSNSAQCSVTRQTGPDVRDDGREFFSCWEHDYVAVVYPIKRHIA